MKTVFEHIEHVKGKPHHIRRRVALSAAAGVSGLIALVWLSANLFTGSFAITGSNFALSTGEGAAVATTSGTTDAGLAGAAAALQTPPSSSAPASIQIVDTTPAPSQQKQADQTIIPF